MEDQQTSGSKCVFERSLVGREEEALLSAVDTAPPTPPNHPSDLQPTQHKHSEVETQE